MRRAYLLAKWQMRADTILRKAQELNRDMICALGVEHELTDYGDNVVDWAEQLSDLIARHRAPTTIPASTAGEGGQ